MRQGYFDHPSRSHNRPSSAKLPSLVEIESPVIDARNTGLCQTAHMIDDSLNQALIDSLDDLEAVAGCSMR